MMDLSTIHQLSRDAARRAKRAGQLPTVFTETQIMRAKEGDISAISGIANLGEHLPKGWKRVHVADKHGAYVADAAGYGAYFVDKSGFGAPGEPALTIAEFINELKPGLGYAIVEEGQFQVKIGVFAQRTDQPRRRG